MIPPYPLVEHAALPQRDAHRLEVTGAHRVAVWTLFRARQRNRIRLKEDAVLFDISAQGQLAGESRAGDTRHLPHRFDRIGEKPLRDAVVVEPMSADLDLHGEETGRIES